MERRLAAIFAADVVGYSRLMGANEVGTLQALQRHLSELVGPEVEKRGGRVVKHTGDGVLVEFQSVVSAVECAAAIQRAMPLRNADVPPDRRIQYRIGINLDDVIVRSEDGLPNARMGLSRAEAALRKHPESSRPAQLGATTLAAIGEVEEAKRWLKRALAIDPDDTHIKYNAACVWAQLGEPDKAFDLLEEWALHSGRENRDWMLHDPDLNALRSLPRFNQIIDQIDARIAEHIRTMA